MLQIRCICKRELDNQEDVRFLDECGNTQGDQMAVFHQNGDEWQMIIDCGGFEMKWWQENRDRIPKGFYLGRALLKINLGGGTLMFPMIPELSPYDKGQKFGLPGVDLSLKHCSSQFVKFDIWRLVYPPKISLFLRATNERLVPSGSMEIPIDEVGKEIRWQGFLDYEHCLSDEDRRMFSPVYTWNLKDFLPDMMKVEYQKQLVLLVNREMKIRGCYEQGRYFYGIQEHSPSLNSDIFSQIALMV